LSRAEDLYERIIKEGESAIDDFILQRKAEELFLDFKRSSDNGKNRHLSQIDRNNLAKAISGFGNSEGGVIVWGVDCSPDFDGADVAKAKFPIYNVKRYVSWLEGTVSGCTIPPHSGVQNTPIQNSDSSDGYVATYVPKSNYAPHQVVGRLQYYIRAGSDFVPTPHQVLAGMFGRRPQPNVFHQWGIEPAQISSDQIDLLVGVILMNNGRGIAYDPFVTCTIFGEIGENCQISIDPPDTSQWHINWIFGMQVSVIARDDFRLPPSTKAQTIAIHFKLRPPFNQKLYIKGTVGCRNAPPKKFVLENDAENLTKIYERYTEKFNSGTLSEKDRHQFVEAFLTLK